MAAAHSGDCKTYMYSHSYSYAWGCRCCVTGAQYQRHGLWNTDQCCSGAAAIIMPGLYQCS